MLTYADARTQTCPFWRSIDRLIAEGQEAILKEEAGVRNATGGGALLMGVRETSVGTYADVC
jgi:hypothetical protein